MEFSPGLQRWFHICKLINVMNSINTIKDKNHMNLSTDEGKSFDKIKHPVGGNKMAEE